MLLRGSNSFSIGANWQKVAKLSQFVPTHAAATQADIDVLQHFLFTKPNTLVLTGAGVSTESGIPDYRSKDVGLYARSDRRPIENSEFLRSADARKRYWARNFVAWPRFSRIIPNDVHYTLARLEREGRIQGIVTQNVDRLHLVAGSRNVVELHGNGFIVKCTSCNFSVSRHEFQSILSTLNTHMKWDVETLRPDGDVDIPQESVNAFNVPPCPDCSAVLKPNIVFFGDSVPKERIHQVSKMVYESDGLLVLGSSLLVFSGYRILLQAMDLDIPIAIINIGATRGDHLSQVKISTRCGSIIPHLFPLPLK